MNPAIGFVIATVILVFGSRYVSVPLTMTVARSQGRDPRSIFLAVDGTVMGVAGFLLGFMMHQPFIGFSMSKQGWVGMIAFIAGSFLGSHLG